MLGGGLRQAGVLAAAGLYALEHNIDRLADDHRRAASIAAGLAAIKGVAVAQNSNMIFVDIEELNWRQIFKSWLNTKKEKGADYIEYMNEVQIRYLDKILVAKKVACTEMV